MHVYCIIARRCNYTSVNIYNFYLSKNMKYELMLLVKPLTNEDIKDKVLSKIEKQVKELKGKFEVKESIGKRLLSYAIKKFKEGYYLLADVELEPEDLVEFRRGLSLQNDVLRFLLIKADNL